MTKDDRRSEYQKFNNKRTDFIAIIQASLFQVSLNPGAEYRTRDLQFAVRTSYCIPSDMSAVKAASEFLRHVDYYSIDEDSTPLWMRPSWVDDIVPE